jgi:hypothetical protein
MAFTLRSVKVPPNSASLEEARHRVFDFFRAACRSLPSVMEIYNLQDVATVSQLRSTIASEIRKNSHVTDPKVHFFSFLNFIFFAIGFAPFDVDSMNFVYLSIIVFAIFGYIYSF